MAQRGRPSSEHLTRRQRGSDCSMDEQWLPILSLSKSTTEVEASRHCQIEALRAGLELQRSLSSAPWSHSNTGHSQAHSPHVEEELISGPSNNAAALPPGGYIQPIVQGGCSGNRSVTDKCSEAGTVCTRTGCVDTRGPGCVDREGPGCANPGCWPNKQQKFTCNMYIWGQRNHSGQQHHELGIPSGNQMGTLTRYQLMPSISEMWLDSQDRECCQRAGGQGRCASLPSVWLGRAYRDAGTVTSRVELRDTAVQTVSLDSVPSVFTHRHGTADDESQVSPVRSVTWDSEGMTWDVYGASVDPVELAHAMQKHLAHQAHATCEPHPREQDSPVAMTPQSRARRTGGCLSRSSCCLQSSAAGD